MKVDCGLWYLYNVVNNKGIDFTWVISSHVSDWAQYLWQVGVGVLTAVHCRNCHLGWVTLMRSVILYFGNQVKSRYFLYIFGDKGRDSECNPNVLLQVEFFLTFYRMQCARRLFQLVNLITVSWQQKPIDSFKIL